MQNSIIIFGGRSKEKKSLNDLWIFRKSKNDLNKW